MILLIKKNNLMFAGLVLLLCLSILGINLAFRGGESASAAAVVPTLNTKGKTVVLDAGHGGEDPGAVSSYNGISEKDVTLILAGKLQKLLEKDGYKVLMTRTEDELVYEGENLSMTAKRRQDLLRRKQMMDESGADIVLSIHLNSYTDSRYSGAQTFYTKNSRSGKKLAEAIQESLKISLDPENDREAIQKKEDILITKNCKCTTVIVECGFLSNQEECRKLSDEAYQEKLSEAIKGGIDRYFTVMTPESETKK